VVKILCHLETDVTGANHDGMDRVAPAPFLCGQSRIHPGLDAIHIADAAEHLDGGVIDARQRRAHG